MLAAPQNSASGMMRCYCLRIQQIRSTADHSQTTVPAPDSSTGVYFSGRVLLHCFSAGRTLGRQQHRPLCCPSCSMGTLPQRFHGRDNCSRLLHPEMLLSVGN